MRKQSLIAMSLAAVLFASGGARAEEENCRLGRYASLPIAFDQDGGATVPITLNGQVQTMLVDTGGAYSMLTESAVAQLNLSPMTSQYVEVQMFGGLRSNQYVTVGSLDMAGIHFPNKDFMLMPDGFMPAADNGILAPDILKIFDVDLDFAAGKLNLMSQKHCRGQVVYWTQDPYAQIPFFLVGWHLRIKLQLDGQEVLADLDTGAFRSVMSLETAKELFKIDDAVLSKNNNRYPFKILSLHGVTVNNPDIVLLPDAESKVLDDNRAPKMLLGMGVLRQLHLYIAYKEHKIYVTPASAH